MQIIRLKAKWKRILTASTRVNLPERLARNLRFDLKEMAILIRHLERKCRERYRM
jgi:hypothetical protein